MSKHLVAFVNATNQPISFVNKENSQNNQSLTPNSMFTTDTYFNVPDNSDSSKYFDGHHMEVQDGNGNIIFSFWDNDDNNFLLSYCQSNNWGSTTQSLPGYNIAGDGINIGLVLTGGAGNYALTSYLVSADV